MQNKKAVFLGVIAVIIIASTTAILALPILHNKDAQQLEPTIGLPSGSVLWLDADESKGSPLTIHDFEQNTTSACTSDISQVSDIRFLPNDPTRLTGTHLNTTGLFDGLYTSKINRNEQTGFTLSELDIFFPPEVQTDIRSFESPRWFPDCNWISYKFQENYWVYQPDQNKVSKMADANVLSVEFLSKGELLYFDANLPPRGTLQNIVKHSAKASESTPILRNVSGLRLSNNRRYAAYTSQLRENTVFVYDLQTGDNQSVLLAGGKNIDSYIPSPDGRYLLYSAPTNRGNYAVVIQNIKNQAVQTLGYTSVKDSLDWADGNVNSVDEIIDQVT